jgi:hypothetical protein
MKEPEQLSYFFADHANGRFTASFKPVPGLKHSHYTAPIFVTPLASNALPMPGAAEHNPPKVDTTVGSLAADNHRKQFGREGLGAKSEGFRGYILDRIHCKITEYE